LIFDSLRGVAIQESVGINSVFLPGLPITYSLTTQVNSQNQTRFLYQLRFSDQDCGSFAKNFLVLVQSIT
jgi:hypothetical protein